MKKQKIIGITLIVAAILLQVGYAAATGQIINTVNIGEFKVNFESAEVTHEDLYIDVKATPNQKNGVVSVDVQNLYPGAKFGVTSTVKNSGELDATITKIEIVQRQKSKIYSELYNHLVGYTTDESYKTIEDYNTYLQEKYINIATVVKAGDTLPIAFDMGLAPEATGVKEEQAQFDIIIQFGQEEPSQDPGPDEEEGDGDNGNNGGNRPGTDVETPDEDLPEETLPGGEIDIQEETVPGGAIDIQEEVVPGGAIDVQEEGIPGGVALPQTGGIAPTLVYGIGIVLLGSGIAIYKKKDEKDK